MKMAELNVEVPVFQRDGGRMPILGLGTYEMQGKTCRKAVAAAIGTGYRHIDTARMYENEEEVGQGIRDAGIDRGALFLTTKLQGGSLDAHGVHASCERSLKALKVEYLDLLLIHWPEEQTPLEETLGAMAELRGAGKIRHVGVSNFTVDWLEKAAAATDVPIFCNQIEYHPYIAQGPPQRFCREHDIAVVAYSPLARGRAAKDERLIEIGRHYDKTPAQVALRWLVRQTGVAAIPKGSSPEHIGDNLDVFDFDFTKEDLAAIAELEKDKRLIDPDQAPDWDT